MTLYYPPSQYSIFPQDKGEEALKSILAGVGGYQQGKQGGEDRKMQQQLMMLKMAQLRKQIEQMGQPEAPSALDKARTQKLKKETQFVGKPTPKAKPTIAEQYQAALDRKKEALEIKELEEKIKLIGRKKPETGSSELARLKTRVLEELINPDTTPQRRKQLESAGVFGKAGVSVTANILPEGNVPLTKTATSGVQDKIIGIQDTNEKLTFAVNNFDDKFLKYSGRLGAMAVRVADKAGVATDAQKKFLTEYTRWFKPVKQFFQAYKKEITGVAASPQEIKDIKASTISETMSPTEFRATVKVLLEQGTKMYNRLFMLMTMGLNPNLASDRAKIDLSNVPLDRDEAIKQAQNKQNKTDDVFTLGEIRTNSRGQEAKYLGEGRWQLLQ